MPADLPGFYFDPERNRYFPLPRAQGGRSGPPAGDGNGGAGHRQQDPRGRGQVEVRKVDSCPRVDDLLRSRERGGSHGGRGQGRTFQRKFYESQTAGFRVWEYSKQPRRADAALEWVRLRVQMPEGERQAAALFVGGSSGSLGVWDTDVRATSSDMDELASSEASDSDIETSLDGTWLDVPNFLGGLTGPEPIVGSSLGRNSANHAAPGGSHMRPPVLWRSPDEVMFSSPIRTIHRLSGGGETGNEGETLTEQVVVSTFGTEGAGGAVIVLEMRDPPLLGGVGGGRPWQVRPFVPWRISATHSMPGWTLWTSQPSPNRGTVSLGHSGGAALLSLESSHRQMLCRSGSAVLAQQVDATGNIVFCGFRNGVISTIDIRVPPPPPQLTPHWSRPPPVRPASLAPPGRVTARGLRHHYSQRGGALVSRKDKTSRQTQRKAGQYAPLYCSHSPVARMSSSIASMRLLTSDQNYLVAGAMDGTMSRWDRRMVKSPVLHYEGHVNTHSSLPLAVDPSETLLLAGGEDCHVRIWSLSSGRQLACAGTFLAPATSLCWPSLDGPFGGYREQGQWETRWFGDSHPWGCWMGSRDSIFYAHGAG